MPSPFPGMNPYLEQAAVWHDLRITMMAALSAQIVPQVVPDCIVLIGMRYEIGETPEEAGLPESEWDRARFLEVRDRHSRELIAVIELLSPSNKRPGADRDRYLARRGDLIASPVHLIEIDLLRGGVLVPAEKRPACDYSVLVSRAEDRLRAGFWPIGLRERLPVVPIPLRSPDDPARVDLQAAVDRVYDDAGYAHFIYARDPEPPLTPDQADWARTFLDRPA